MTAHQKSIWLSSYHRRAKRFKALGLNSRGKAYRRRPNVAPGRRAAHQRQVNLAKWRHRRDQFKARGLNSRGQSFARADFTAGPRLNFLLENFRAGKSLLTVGLKGKQ